MSKQLKEGRDYIEKAYVIGAGFSKSLGLPHMSELLGELNSFCAGGLGVRYRKLPERFGQFTKTFLPSFSGDREIVRLFDLLQSAVDMEEAVPAVAELMPSRILADLRKTLCQFFHFKLAEITTESPGTVRLFFEQHGSAVFVSFNWDNVLEHGLYTTGARVRLFEHKEPDADVFVFKLHGSADWVIRRGEEPWLLSTYWPLSYPLCKGEHRNEEAGIGRRIRESRLRSVEYPGTAWVHVRDDPHEPMLVTMGHGKGRTLAEEQYSRIHKAWKEAAKFLSRAHRIIIIGYSIPDEDVEARLLLRYAIWQHQEQFGYPPTVKVIDPSEETIRAIEHALATDVERVAARFDPSDREQWA
jgi:hypothetical protein